MRFTYRAIIIILITISPLQNSYAKIGLIDEFIRFIPEIATFTKNLFKESGSLKNSNILKSADNVDPLAAGKIQAKDFDINFIDEIGKGEHKKIFDGIKKSDDNFLGEYKNLDQEPIVNDLENSTIWKSFFYTRNVYRASRNIKPDPDIYVCKTNKYIYYFILLPKKNIALVNSTNPEIEKQRLSVVSATSDLTYLKTINEITHFSFFPNYTAFISNEPTGDSKRANAECYNMKPDGSSLIRYEDVKELKKPSDNRVVKNVSEKKKIIGSFLLNNYIKIALALAIWSILFLLINEIFLKKKKKEGVSNIEIIDYLISSVLWGFVGLASLLMTSYFTWNFWIELLYAAVFIIYLYIAFYPVKNELLIIKLSKTSQFNKTRVALAYWSIVVPSLFVSTAIALLFI